MRRGEFANRRDGARVDFDGGQGGRFRGKQRAREPARARTDLHDMTAIERAGLPGDRGRQVKIEQKMLTERPFGIEPVPREDIAQPVNR